MYTAIMFPPEFPHSDVRNIVFDVKNPIKLPFFSFIYLFHNIGIYDVRETKALIFHLPCSYNTLLYDLPKIKMQCRRDLVGTHSLRFSCVVHIKIFSLPLHCHPYTQSPALICT